MGKKAPALAAAEKAEAKAAAHRETAQQKRARIAELEERAELFGDSAKQSYNAQCLQRKWQRFLLVHGEEYAFDGKSSPTVELVKKFVTYCYCTRDVVSAIGMEGMGDSYELQIRYMLAKFVFVSLKYSGWEGLDAHALHVKAEPYKFAVGEHWKRLKRSDKDLMSTLKPFVKHKWDDLAYFLAQVRMPCVLARHGWRAFSDGLCWVPSQDHCMAQLEEKRLHPLVFVSRMAVMGFTRGTCSRGGSACKDWFDRSGKIQDAVLGNAQRPGRG